MVASLGPTQPHLRHGVVLGVIGDQDGLMLPGGGCHERVGRRELNSLATELVAPSSGLHRRRRADVPVEQGRRNSRHSSRSVVARPVKNSATVTAHTARWSRRVDKIEDDSISTARSFWRSQSGRLCRGGSGRDCSRRRRRIEREVVALPKLLDPALGRLAAFPTWDIDVGQRACEPMGELVAVAPRWGQELLG